MTDAGFEEAVRAMWQRFAPLAAGRVDVLEAYAAQLAAGRAGAAEQREAHSAAHKLAGALGTYGRPGSDEAGRLEVLLADAAALPDAAQVAPLVAALRRAVTD